MKLNTLRVVFPSMLVWTTIWPSQDTARLGIVSRRELSQGGRKVLTYWPFRIVRTITVPSCSDQIQLSCYSADTLPQHAERVFKYRENTLKALKSLTRDQDSWALGILDEEAFPSRPCTIGMWKNKSKQGKRGRTDSKSGISYVISISKHYVLYRVRVQQPAYSRVQ